jgi:ribosome biogenesis GTPase / thiamine phosphate phosphatase
VSFPTLEPYGWGGRWEALFAEVDGSEAPPPDARAAPPDSNAGQATGTDSGAPDRDAGLGPSPGSGTDGNTGADAPPDSRSDAGLGAAPVPGRVLRHDGVAVSVALPDGVSSRPLRRGLDPPPVVGDWVVEQAGVLRAVLPRSSLLERKSARREQPQALAANVDLVLVVCGLDRPVRAGRIQRTATLAWEAGAVPSVVLTKADRVAQEEADEAADRVMAENPGLDVLVTSTRTGQGADALRAAVKDWTVVLVGESGAGKSSLVNLLLDSEAAAVGDVRKGDFKGRHTTASRELHVVPTGGVVIDTPGIRSVGLWADAEAVATTFDDIDDLAAGCRFADCRHDTEPGCAVRTAIEDGALAADRLARWRALEREAIAAERRADPHAQKVWGRSFARVTKDAQRRKGRS